MLKVFFLMMFSLFFTQNSSFLSSLILAPLSVLVLSFLSSQNMAYALMMLLMVMIFVGGLLIFITSVSSLLAFEQSFFQISWLGTLVLPALGSMLVTVTSMEPSAVSVWLASELVLVIFLALFVLIALIIISMIFFKNKFLVRSDCFFSVSA